MSELPFLKSRAVVVLAGEIDVDLSRYLKADDYIVAVDGGIEHLNKFNITPDILIGDLDSISSDFSGQILKFDEVKDDTDFKCSLNYIEDNHIASEIIVFGFGSIDRIDHVLANLSIIKSNISLLSKNQQITLIDQDTEVVSDAYKYYSFFSTEIIDEFSLEGFKYPLDKYCLHPFDPLCVSNELAKPTGKIKISNGQLIVIKSLKN